MDGASNHHRFSDVAPSLVDPIPLLQQISFWVQFGLIFVTFCSTLVTILLVVPPWLQPALHVTWDAEHGDRDRPCLASLQHHHPHRHLRGVHLQLWEQEAQNGREADSSTTTIWPLVETSPYSDTAVQSPFHRKVLSSDLSSSSSKRSF